MHTMSLSWCFSPHSQWYIIFKSIYYAVDMVTVSNIKSETMPAIPRGKKNLFFYCVNSKLRQTWIWFGLEHLFNANATFHWHSTWLLGIFPHFGLNIGIFIFVAISYICTCINQKIFTFITNWNSYEIFFFYMITCYY